MNAEEKKEVIQRYIDWIVSKPEFKEEVKKHWIKYLDTGKVEITYDPDLFERKLIARSNENTDF